MLRAAAQVKPSARLRSHFSFNGSVAGIARSQPGIRSITGEFGAVLLVKLLAPMPGHSMTPRQSELVPLGDVESVPVVPCQASTSLSNSVLEVPSRMSVILVPLPEPVRLALVTLLTTAKMPIIAGLGLPDGVEWMNESPPKHAA